MEASIIDSNGENLFLSMGELPVTLNFWVLNWLQFHPGSI